MAIREDFSDYRSPDLRNHYVYRAYDSNDRLLYVGCTINIEKRMAEHRSTGRWAQNVTRIRVRGPLSYPVARRQEKHWQQVLNPLFKGQSESRRRRKTPPRISLQGLREAQKWTLYDLSRAIERVTGVKYSSVTLGEIESGRRAATTRELKDLAAGFGFGVGDFSAGYSPALTGQFFP